MKKIIPKFFGKILNGRFVFNQTDLRNYNGYIGTFEEGKEVEMTVKNKTKKRSSGQQDEETNQNGYWWGVPVAMVCDELGEFDKEYIHNWLQIKVGNSVLMPDGTIVAKGTSELSAGEFEDLCSKVRQWCAVPGNICEDGMYIPEPHEAEYNERG